MPSGGELWRSEFVLPPRGRTSHGKFGVGGREDEKGKPSPPDAVEGEDENARRLLEDLHRYGERALDWYPPQNQEYGDSTPRDDKVNCDWTVTEWITIVQYVPVMPKSLLTIEEFGIGVEVAAALLASANPKPPEFLFELHLQRLIASKEFRNLLRFRVWICCDDMGNLWDYYVQKDVQYSRTGFTPVPVPPNPFTPLRLKFSGSGFELSESVKSSGNGPMKTLARPGAIPRLTIAQGARISWHEAHVATVLSNYITPWAWLGVSIYPVCWHAYFRVTSSVIPGCVVYIGEHPADEYSPADDGFGGGKSLADFVKSGGKDFDYRENSNEFDFFRMAAQGSTGLGHNGGNNGFWARAY